MKKMSNVFKLPLWVPVPSDDELHDNYGNAVAEFTSRKQAQYAASAINNADALAEALEAIVSDYNQYRAVNGIDLTDDHCANLDVKMTTAEAALAAYRGEL